MKIVVLGLGKIGTTISKRLLSEGHDIVAVDSDSRQIEEISNSMDVMCLCGNGTDVDTLIEAGVESADLFISVTGSDEVNMLTCFLAKRLGAGHTIARIRNPEYNDKNMTFLKGQLDLSYVINPELLAAQEIFNVLKFPSAVNIESFSRRNFEIVEIVLHEGSKLIGMKLYEMRKKFDSKFLVCIVQRGDEVIIPGGDFQLQLGDKIGITATRPDIHKLFKAMGLFQKQGRNVMILGASRTSYYLGKMLTSAGSSVKIIDPNAERCNDFSRDIPEAVIINGDGARPDLLVEEGIDDSDAFVALTGIDEENILLSFFATSHGVPKVMSKVTRTELGNMANKIGLESIVSPRNIVSDMVSRYARALQNSGGSSNIETLYKIMDGKAEAIEFKVGQEFRYQEVPIRELRLHRNILIAGIIRGRRALIPTGNDAISAGDRVIVISASGVLHDLQDIFEE